ncbi:hypothetical protein MRX96_036793 [Rhipicephalus microplus]
MLSGDRFASFVCPDCSAKFTTLSHLQAHWLREHHRCQQQQTTQLLLATWAPAEQGDYAHVAFFHAWRSTSTEQLRQLEATARAVALLWKRLAHPRLTRLLRSD